MAISKYDWDRMTRDQKRSYHREKQFRNTDYFQEAPGEGYIVGIQKGNEKRGIPERFKWIRDPDYVPATPLAAPTGITGAATPFSAPYDFGVDPQAREDYTVSLINSIFGHVPEYQKFRDLPSQAFEFDPRFSNKWLIDIAQKNKDDRTGVYNDIRSGVTDYHTEELNRQKEGIDRNRKFAFARRGTSFGSADLDTQLGIDRNYDTAIGKIAARGNQAVDQVRGSDEQARLDLIEQIRSGAKLGDVYSNALSRLDRNQSDAFESTVGDTFGNAFSDIEDVIRYNEFITGQGQGQRAYAQSRPFNFSYKPYFGRDF